MATAADSSALYVGTVDGKVFRSTDFSLEAAHAAALTRTTKKARRSEPPGLVV